MHKYRQCIYTTHSRSSKFRSIKRSFLFQPCLQYNIFFTTSRQVVLLIATIFPHSRPSSLTKEIFLKCHLNMQLPCSIIYHKRISSLVCLASRLSVSGAKSYSFYYTTQTSGSSGKPSHLPCSFPSQASIADLLPSSYFSPAHFWKFSLSTTSGFP